MLHACVQKFDVTRNLEKFDILSATKQSLTIEPPLFPGKSHGRFSFVLCCRAAVSLAARG